MRLSEHVLFNTGGNRSWQSCWRRNDGLCCSIMLGKNGQWSGYSPGFACGVSGFVTAVCSMLSALSKSTGAGIIAIPVAFFRGSYELTASQLGLELEIFLGSHICRITDWIPFP